MRSIKLLVVLIVLALFIGFSTANAQRTNDPASPQATYSIDWYTIDGGGAMFSSGGSYSLGGTIGQADAGTLVNGSYTLVGGFWGGSSVKYNTYLPLALKSF